MSVMLINVGARFTFLTAAGLITGTVTFSDFHQGQDVYHLENVVMSSPFGGIVDPKKIDTIRFIQLYGNQIVGITAAIEPPPNQQG